MTKRPSKEDWHWPLAALDYAHEVHDFFPEEAAILGSITILWNRQELALRHLFVDLLTSPTPEFAGAIWDRQSTHQARRDLLALAIDHAQLTDRQSSILRWVIENTKKLADRRNELIHAEYVVHARTEVLHAKVKAPRSSKPAKHQKLSLKDLRKVERDLVYLLQGTEAAWGEMPRGQKLIEEIGIRKLAREQGILKESA